MRFGNSTRVQTDTLRAEDVPRSVLVSYINPIPIGCRPHFVYTNFPDCVVSGCPTRPHNCQPELRGKRSGERV